MRGNTAQSWQGAAARPRAPPSHWRIPASNLLAPTETSAVSSRLGKCLRAPPQEPAQATVIADGAQPGACAALDLASHLASGLLCYRDSTSIRAKQEICTGATKARYMS